MKRTIANLNNAGCNRALRAALGLLALSVSGCADDKNTDPPPSASLFEITVSVTGSGQVTSPSGIDCGSDCAEILAAGSNITLSASPASGFTFSGWSGGCSGNSPNCALILNSSHALTATFVASPPAPDVTPPDVSLSAPAAGEVSGTVVLSANATDNVAVAGVQFRVNGVNHDSEDTVAPYRVSWNTASLPPGDTYILSAVARDTSGLTATSTGVTVTVRAPPPVPQGLIFFDDFEYDVGRQAANAISIFQQMGLWSGGKTQQSSTGARGYLYTATSIPGYDRGFPGGASSRVLVMEALPGSLGGQTDFYLEYGNGESAAYDNAVPGNVWFQFWVYVNHYVDAQDPPQVSHLSRLDTAKFIYPCNGPYGCHTHKWMMTLSGRSAEPSWESLGTPLYESPTNGSAFMNNIANTIYPANDPVSTITNSRADTGNEWKLGHTNTAEHFTANRWTLVKIHLDTSTSSGVYEAWMRPLGGSWVQTARWISGVTSGFTWTINASQVGGHRVFRMPSTIGEADGGSTSYDVWIYMDDFAMATTEAALPQYEEPL